MRKIVIFLIAILCSLIIVGAAVAEENVSDELASQEEMKIVSAPEGSDVDNETLTSSNPDNLKETPNERVSISVTLFWNDAENNSTRPNGIDLYLYANGVEVDDVYLTSKNAVSDEVWAYTFEDLPKNDEDGNPITYTVGQPQMSFYTQQIMKNSNYEFMIINTFSMPQPQPSPDDPVDDGPSGDAIDDGSQDDSDTNNNTASVNKKVTKNPENSKANNPVKHNNTGNPLFVLVLVVISTVFISIRRKD